jgi:putative flavoprotein involved in K+ transport
MGTRRNAHLVGRPVAEQVETVIVGAGQCGLAMSYWLTQAGCEHLVLERGEIGERWHRERWDSLRVLAPNWTVALPSAPYAGPDPDGFMGRDEVAGFLAAYAALFTAPVRTGTPCTHLGDNGRGTGFALDTPSGRLEARNVVIATGPYQEPAVPAFSTDLPPGLTQVHARAYRNPQQLPSGAVLVVGSGASGLQIAEELCESGRNVYLSVGRHSAPPRRYRGRDLTWWLLQAGMWDRRVEELASPQAKYGPRPAWTGVGGGHDLGVRQLAGNGARLLGHVHAAADGRIAVTPDVATSIRDADERAHAMLTRVDEVIAQSGFAAPADAEAERWPDPSRYDDGATEVDLGAAGITSVVWATGFKYAWDWVHLPVFDAQGEPHHRRGVSSWPGLYFLGLLWLAKLKSSFIFGAGEDAEYLAQHIVTRARELSR